MREKVHGYKTVVVAALLFLYALASWSGIDIPEPDGEQALTGGALLMVIMRMLTDGPLGGDR
jgi:hypothetical protein